MYHYQQGKYHPDWAKPNEMGCGKVF